MPFPIQALPKGLVSFLDLNTGGAGPAVLADQVGAVLDLLPFLALPKRVRKQSIAIAMGTSVGDFAFAADFTVPQTEAWLLLTFHVSASIPIGLNATLQAGYQATAAPNNSPFPLGPMVSNTTTALANIIRAHATQVPFLLAPGSILAGCTNNLSAATAFNGVGIAEYVPFRI